MSPAVTVTAAGEDDWALVRDVRLRALADAPDAFESSSARERSLTEEDWRARLLARAQRVGWVDGQPAGLAAGIAHRVEHHLVGMWVAPEARGTGLADALVRSVVDWARTAGAAQLHLWVVGDNEVARRLYVRHGFLPTGRVQPLPARPWQTEVQYALGLD